MQEAMKVAMPFAIGNLVSFFLGNSTISRDTAWGYAIMMIVLSFSLVIPTASFLHGQACLEMRMRAACSGLIFRKVVVFSL